MRNPQPTAIPPFPSIPRAIALPAAASLLLFLLLFSAPFPIQSPVSFFSRRVSDAPVMAARSFVMWLHGLGDSGPANEPIKNYFTSPEFKSARWSFPSAPNMPVSCNCEPLLRLLSWFCSWFIGYLVFLDSPSFLGSNWLIHCLEIDLDSVNW